MIVTPFAQVSSILYWWFFKTRSFKNLCTTLIIPSGTEIQNPMFCNMDFATLIWCQQGSKMWFNTGASLYNTVLQAW